MAVSCQNSGTEGTQNMSYRSQIEIIWTKFGSTKFSDNFIDTKKLKYLNNIWRLLKRRFLALSIIWALFWLLVHAYLCSRPRACVQVSCGYIEHIDIYYIAFLYVLNVYKVVYVQTLENAWIGLVI
jgi:hypothetical protein